MSIIKDVEKERSEWHSAIYSCIDMYDPAGGNTFHKEELFRFKSFFSHYEVERIRERNRIADGFTRSWEQSNSIIEFANKHNHEEIDCEEED